MEFNSLQEQFLMRAAPVSREYQKDKGKKLPHHSRQTQAVLPPFQTRKRQGCLGCQRSPQKLGSAFLEKIPRNWKEFYYIPKVSMKILSKKYTKFEYCAIVTTYKLGKSNFKEKSSNTKQRKCPNPNIQECLL